jgi:hypothetical protein
VKGPPPPYFCVLLHFIQFNLKPLTAYRGFSFTPISWRGAKREKEVKERKEGRNGE